MDGARAWVNGSTQCCILYATDFGRPTPKPVGTRVRRVHSESGTNPQRRLSQTCNHTLISARWSCPGQSRKTKRIFAAGSNGFLPESCPPEAVIIRVQFCVKHKCQYGQRLFVAGSSFPLGWSFLRIAQIPMTLRGGSMDIWEAAVDFCEGVQLEYKYVIIEDQDWVMPNSGVYQSGQKSIVAWQPGANRPLGIPTASKVQEYLEDSSDFMQAYKASGEARALNGSRLEVGYPHHDRDPDFLYSCCCDLW